MHTLPSGSPRPIILLKIDFMGLLLSKEIEMLISKLNPSLKSYSICEFQTINVIKLFIAYEVSY